MMMLLKKNYYKAHRKGYSKPQLKGYS